MNNIHQNIYNKLDIFIQKQKIPHILFYGNSGSGKRTIVNNFIKKIYGNDNNKIKSNVMFVNCAHGKGIKFIREDLKFFAKTNIKSNNGSNFKTIVLLNGSFLTIDAQSALRRCIELFSYNTRFFMLVENKNKILNPILSRFCEIYISDIINNENINLHKHYKNMNISDEINNKNDWLTTTITKIKKKNNKNLFTLVEKIYNEGYSCIDLMNWYNNNSDFIDIDKAYTNILFEKIKSEYKSEKMLMMFIFDFIYLRSDKDLKCITTI